MDLSLTLLTRPGRTAAVVAVVGLLSLVQGAIALRWQVSGFGWDSTVALALSPAVAFGGSALALGALVPLVGRRGRLGLRLARWGLALVLAGTVAAVGLGAPLRAVAVAGLIVTLAGMRLVTGAAQRAGEISPWTPTAVTAGLAGAALFPAGGACVLGLAWLATAASLWSVFGAAPEPRLA